MTKEFGYPEFAPDGAQILTLDHGKDSWMSCIVYRMQAGEVRKFNFADQEQAILLMYGDVEFAWEDKTERIARETFFDEGKGSCCLHVAKGVEVTVKAFAETEIMWQATENDREFASKLYHPNEIRNEVFGTGDDDPGLQQCAVFQSGRWRDLHRAGRMVGLSAPWSPSAGGLLLPGGQAAGLRCLFYRRQRLCDQGSFVFSADGWQVPSAGHGSGLSPVHCVDDPSSAG